MTGSQSELPDPVGDVLEPLQEITRYGHRRFAVYRDWVRLMLAALQRDDERYLEVLDQYDDHRDEIAELFSEGLGELQLAMRETNRDVLGMCYESWGVQNEEDGQHFTPHSASQMMVETLVDDDDDVDPPVTIADPTCGSGRMLVLAARHYDCETFVFGQDKDSVCAKIAALNCCFFNVNGVIVQGDTITMEKQRAWRTRHTIAGGEIAEVEDPESIPLPEAAFEGPDDDDVDGRVSIEDVSDQAALSEFVSGQ